MKSDYFKILPLSLVLFLFNTMVFAQNNGFVKEKWNASRRTDSQYKIVRF